MQFSPKAMFSRAELQEQTKYLQTCISKSDGCQLNKLTQEENVPRESRRMRLKCSEKNMLLLGVYAE